ncbi:ABC transporter ATP-binding protein, partial [Halobacteriales archaeon QS_4_69_225]
MASVTLKDVKKEYDDVTAVDNMNLEIRDGEFVTFVGPSGCGKSTTMETIAGLTIPT